MTANEIIADIAREKRVEEIIRKVFRLADLPPAYRDLAQMVYVILLEYDPALIVDLYERDAVNFLIVRLVKNNTSARGQWYAIYRRYGHKAVELSGVEAMDGEG